MLSSGVSYRIVTGNIGTLPLGRGGVGWRFKPWRESCSVLPRPAGLCKEEVISLSRYWGRMSTSTYQFISCLLLGRLSISVRNFYFYEKPAFFFIILFSFFKVLDGQVGWQHFGYWCSVWFVNVWKKLFLPVKEGFDEQALLSNVVPNLTIS